MSAQQKRIGVFLPNGPAYFARVFAGIGMYMRGHHRWRIVAWPSFMNPLGEMNRTVRDLQLDGAIGQASAMWEDLVRTHRIAFVNAEHSDTLYPNLPRVGLDEAEIARLASLHFKERGLRHLAMVSIRGSLPATERASAFADTVRSWNSAPVHHLRLDFSLAFDESVIERWLAALPTPVGVFCWNDETAKLLHQPLIATGLRVPDDVMLLGVDNDDTICHFLDPELTSIDPNAQRVGYESAALLDRLMSGEPAPSSPILVPPIGVVTRASTDTLAIDSPDVVRAIQFIRERAGTGVSVKQVLDHLSISRRSLETQFKAALGRSPRSEIHRILVDRARDMLASTDLSIPTIAHRCGYDRANHFTTMFRKQTGQTPTAYRKQTRLG